MKKIILLIALAVAILVALSQSKTAESPIVVEAIEEAPKLTHRQEVWIGALEWCESQGKTDAVNPEDLDGTPSYGAFQFKPSTFFYYGEKYGVVYFQSTGENTEADEKAMIEQTKNYEHQKKIVEQMVLHRDEIRWDRQFPGCVKKLGWPPKADVLK